MAIIISDIHGDSKKARMFLEYKPEVEHIILGDLMDSRDYGVTLDDEVECLELLLSSDAVFIWGNHDLAYTDKPCWKPYARINDTYATVSKLIIPHQKRFKAAYAVGGWLCTHAGVSTLLAKMLPDMPLDSGDSETVAVWLNEEFRHQRLVPEKKKDRQQYYGVGPLFAIDWTRGGDDRYGGIFWYDPQREQARPDTRVRQLFGHTPVPGPLKRDEWNNINIEGGCWVFDTEEGGFVLLDQKQCRLAEAAEKALTKPVYDLNKLVDGITPENKHDFSETDFGKPAGKEKL